jgi:PAS domain S-box-containing protein
MRPKPQPVKKENPAMECSQSLGHLTDWRPGNHLCFLYETEEEHQAVLTPFLRQGLEQGEKVIYLWDQRVPETILGYLEGEGVDLEPCLRRGQLLFLSAPETYLDQGRFVPEVLVSLWQREVEKSLAEGFLGLRVTGEMTWALQSAPGVDRLIEYESQMNEFSLAENFLSLCQYDRRRFDPTHLMGVLATHQRAVIGTEMLDNIYYLPSKGVSDPERAATLFDAWMNILADRKRAKDAREQELRRVNEQLRREIEERQQMEDRLRESEARFLAFMQNLPGGAVIRDLEGRYLFANESWEKAFGQKEGEWQRKTLEEIWPEKMAGHMRELDQRVIATRQPVETVVTFSLEEVPRSWLINRFPILDKEGQPVMVGATGIDITARCKAEEALYREKEKYQTLAEKSPLGISIISKDGRYRYLNPKFREIFGYTLEDIPTGRDWFARAYPDPAYRRQVVAAWINDLKYCPPGELQPRSFRVTCKDGSPKIINFSPVSLEGGDQIIIYEDITERLQAEETIRESERRFRQLVESAGDALFLHDAEKIIEVNQQACYSLGYSREELLKMSLLEIEVGFGRQRMQNLWKQNLQTPLTLLGTHRRKDGSTFPVEVKVGDIDYEGRRVRLALARDITDRVQAEEALRQSETKFRTLVEQIPVVTYIAALDDFSTTLYISPQIEAIIGFSPADYETDPDKWKNQLHPDDRERVLAEVTRSRAADEPFSSEYRMLTQEGRVVWLRDEGWVVRDSNGQPLFLQGVMLDITERKELEEALRKSEEEYRLLVNQIPAVVFRGYADWSISCFDRKIEALTGYAKEDFDARRVKWSDLIPAEEMEYVKNSFVEALRTTKSYVREHRVRRKTGDYAWVQCRGQIFCDPEGNVEYVSGVTFDVTKHKQAEAALRESEKRYRLLAENVSDVIWTADLNLRLTYISPSVTFLRGFTPEEVLEQRMDEILSSDSFERAWKTFTEGMALEKRLPDPGRSWTLELEHLCKDGSTVWAEVRASFLRDNSGHPVGILGITRDISKRKEAEDALRRREAVLEAVSFAAAKFLQAGSWQKDIQEIIKRLGKAIQSSRVYIFENQKTNDGTILTSQRYEWVASGISPQIDNPELQNLPLRAAGFGRWEKQLQQGELIFGHVREFPLPEQELLATQNIQSIVVFPIFADQEWWGLIGFDECRWERGWTPCEIEALKAAASTLGAAIQHEQAEKSMRESEEKLRSLTNQLLGAQEKERKRLAAELHDELGHSLLTLKLRLKSLERQLAPQQKALQKDLNQILRDVGETIENVRRLYLDLSPGDLEDLGLTGALRSMIEDFTEVHPKIIWSVRLGNLDGLFPAPIQTAIYRIVQEALTNIGKHAQAKHISLAAARQNHGVSFDIVDDGKGFNRDKVLATKKGLGLLTMEERVNILGGSFELVSQKKQGTRISFTIPVPGERA